MSKRAVRKRIVRGGPGSSRNSSHWHSVSSAAQKAADAGIAYSQLPNDLYPIYDQKPCEKVFEHGNSYIVFGTDRVGKFKTITQNGEELKTNMDVGYGYSGDDGSYMIDLVAGRQSMFKLSSLQDAAEEGLNLYKSGDITVDELYDRFESLDEEEKKRLRSGPSFTNDAARIYISQKTDVDNAFEIITGEVGSPTGRSAIGLKADSIRIFGREGIKLVTHAGSNEPLLNSRGGGLGKMKGIDLIAGNLNKEPYDLQPIPKGTNVVNMVVQTLEVIKTLKDQVDGLITDIQDIQLDIRSHYHISPFFGAPTGIAPNLQTKGVNHDIALESRSLSLSAVDAGAALVEMTYLSPANKNYICSQLNNVN